MQITKRHPYLFVFSFSALLGCVAFLGIYGTYIIDGRNVDWILSRAGDFTQSYIGWCFYRASDWYWPLGLMDNAAYPNSMPILYIDSIPLFDLIFKFLSPFLPETFQFFGIWGLVCFALAGGIGGCIVYRLTENMPSSILSSLFFSLATFALQRLYTHTALAANWIILIALLIVVTFEGELKRARGCSLLGDDRIKAVILRSVCWMTSFFLAVSVNIYYVPIIGIIFFVYLVYDALTRRRIIENVFWVAGALMGMISAFYLFGGFSNIGSTNIAPAGIGYYSGNLNSLLNPMDYGGYLNGFSTLLPSVPFATDGQYEGFAYLGAGLIAMSIIAVIGFTICGKDRRDIILPGGMAQLLAIVSTVVLLSFAATGGFISFNDIVLADIDYPQPLLSIVAVFRSSGRFMWGIWDIVAIAVIVITLKSFPTKIGFIFVIGALLLQCVDLSGAFIERYEAFSTSPNPSNQQDGGYVVNSESLDALMDGKEHLVYIDDAYLADSVYFDTALSALKHGATISDFYYSRKDDVAISFFKKQVRANLARGQADKSTLYMFSDYSEAASCIDALHLYHLNGFVFGSVLPIDGFDEIETIRHIEHNDITNSASIIVNGYGMKDNDLYVVIIYKNTSSGIKTRGITSQETQDLRPIHAYGQFRAIYDAKDLPIEILNNLDGGYDADSNSSSSVTYIPTTIDVYSLSF